MENMVLYGCYDVVWKLWFCMDAMMLYGNYGFVWILCVCMETSFVWNSKDLYGIV